MSSSMPVSSSYDSNVVWLEHILTDLPNNVIEKENIFQLSPNSEIAKVIADAGARQDFRISKLNSNLEDLHPLFDPEKLNIGASLGGVGANTGFLSSSFLHNPKVIADAGSRQDFRISKLNSNLEDLLPLFDPEKLNIGASLGGVGANTGIGSNTGIVSNTGFLSSSFLFASASIRNLTLASLHNASASSESAPYGNFLHKFEALTSFASAALFAPIHLITNLFLSIVSSPFALLSDEAKTYCTNHFIQSAFDISALAIGIIGTFSPDSGQALFSKLITYSVSLLSDKEKALAQNSLDVLCKSWHDVNLLYQPDAKTPKE